MHENRKVAEQIDRLSEVERGIEAAGRMRSLARRYLFWKLPLLVMVLLWIGRPNALPIAIFIYLTMGLTLWAAARMDLHAAVADRRALEERFRAGAPDERGPDPRERARADSAPEGAALPLPDDQKMGDLR